MKILFNDIVQNSTAPAELKSPALAETFNKNHFTINFSEPVNINAVGIGNTDAADVSITLHAQDGEHTALLEYHGSGLYPVAAFSGVTAITVDLLGDYIGRFAAGLGVHIPTAVTKEPGLVSTSESRRTLSGQIVPGLGGYTYRTLSLDSRYKIGPEAMKEIVAGFPYIGRGYPFFIDLKDEAYKLGYSKLYATEKNQQDMVFQGGVRRFLYSRKFDFEEAF